MPLAKYVPDLPNPDDNVRALQDAFRRHGLEVIPSRFGDGATLMRDALADWTGRLLVARKKYTPQAKANTKEEVDGEEQTSEGSGG